MKIIHFVRSLVLLRTAFYTVRNKKFEISLPAPITAVRVHETVDKKKTIEYIFYTW